MSRSTHVAGTVCGAAHGVATCDDLCAVQILRDSDGGGTWAGVIAGIDHVVADCEGAVAGGAASGCVANLSMGGARKDTVDAAVADAAAAGVVMVVAAGNHNADACEYSPARSTHAITVGSTTRRDRYSWFSNYGACVDLYAPGSDVVSAGTTSPSVARSLSGTSMASPRESRSVRRWRLVDCPLPLL